MKPYLKPFDYDGVPARIEAGRDYSFAIIEQGGVEMCIVSEHARFMIQWRKRRPDITVISTGWFRSKRSVIPR